MNEAGAGRSQYDTLRVLAIIDHLTQGGAELMLSNFAAGAPSVGVDLQVAYLAEFSGNPSAEPLRTAGIEPIPVRMPPRLGTASLRAVRRTIAGCQPDLVHTHLGTSDTLGSLAARSLRVPAVCTLHVPNWGGSRRERIKRRLAIACRRLGDARVIAVSEYGRAEYLAQGGERPSRVVTIHNGLDVTPQPGEGAAVRRELGIPPEAFVIGTMSVLRAVKGHAVAIETIARLRELRPEVRLVIVGRGTEFDRLQELARPLGDAVIMTGRRTDVMRVLDAFDVCLHPSYADLFPGAVLEAMAASVPVVATAVGGIPEQIEDGRSGILVEGPPAAERFFPVLEALIEDESRRRRMGEAARRCYEAHFAAGPWLRRTRDLYDEVVREHGRGGKRP